MNTSSESPGTTLTRRRLPLLLQTAVFSAKWQKKEILLVSFHHFKFLKKEKKAGKKISKQGDFPFAILSRSLRLLFFSRR